MTEPIPVPNLEVPSSPKEEQIRASYPGDQDDASDPLFQEYQAFNFPNPALLLAFYHNEISSGKTTLHKWQVDVHEELIEAKGTANNPHKFCLVTCNGSGKDAFIIAPFAIWFVLCKIRSRVIITSSSGVQLTSQTEGYIRDMAEKVNKFHGQEIFRIRQRYIKCRLSGSEIRMFATDEKGRAEGYHPMDPNAEMAIIVNEGKTVSEEIHGALRRCTGYNYWIEVSSPGEPSGFFHRAATTWKHVRRVTTFDCPHLSESDREEDKKELGEHSALYRSKHLALFTSLSDQVVIPMETVSYCYSHPPTYDLPTWTKRRIGIDLAAGGDENVVCFTKGNKALKEYYFREEDTELAADRIHQILKNEKVTNDDEIYADDGGIGHAIIDKLVRRGWSINRVLNQWAAINKKNYGNRGAENWYRVKRLIEEAVIDITALSEKTREQLSTRHFKQHGIGGRIYLESKKEAKAEGRLSPDRADAFILCFCGLNLDDFLNAKVANKGDNSTSRPRTQLRSQEEIAEYMDNLAFGITKHGDSDKKVKAYNSISVALSNN